jgi:hypothetical protein
MTTVYLGIEGSEKSHALAFINDKVLRIHSQSDRESPLKRVANLHRSARPVRFQRTLHSSRWFQPSAFLGGSSPHSPLPTPRSPVPSPQFGRLPTALLQ